VGRGDGRRPRQRLAHQRLGLGRPAQPAQDAGQLDPQSRVLRATAQGLAERGLGLGVPAGDRARPRPIAPALELVVHGVRDSEALSRTLS